ncbi:hypothetical protein IT407_01270 [Candidatus Uhrbacteria bacterium]|nr:hypothetical protein [Candidatus Uhrbacteria bacterium]
MFIRLFKKFFLPIMLDRRYFIGGEFIENAGMINAERFRDFYRSMRTGRNFTLTIFPYLALALLVSLVTWSLPVAAACFGAFTAFLVVDGVHLHDRWVNARTCVSNGTYREHASTPGKFFLLPGAWLVPLVACVALFRAAYVFTPVAHDVITTQVPEPRPSSHFISFIATDLDIEQELAAEMMSLEFNDEMWDRGRGGDHANNQAIVIAMGCRYFDQACIRNVSEYTQADHTYFGFVNRMYTFEGEVFAVDIYRFDRRSGETIHESYDCGGNIRSGQYCMDLAAEYFSHL